MIGDPAGSGQAFTDDEVQAALDRTQVLVRSAPLRPVPTPLPGGTVEYREYLADLTDWEDGETLTNAAYQALSPASADRLAGRWTFASPGVNPPVLITGAVYDVHAAAADLLEQWAARLARQFDLSLPGGTFARSQQAAALREQARAYRARSRPLVLAQGGWS